MKIFIVIAVSTTDVCRFVGKLSKEGLPCVLIRTKKDIFKFECPYKERRTKKDAVAGLHMSIYHLPVPDPKDN